MEKNHKHRESTSSTTGPLEQDVLGVLWEKEEATGREVYSDLKRSRSIALTTVLTVLERLANKGFVTKAKGESVFIYRPAFTKDGFAREVSHGVLKNIFGISASGACASFVDALADVDPQELERLSSLIEKKKKEILRDKRR
ncbi:MAG: BlaI/MecI/CopY family transcriptional regulator [Deltaproteobacteria bacterium]|nr:BlaI/MecI/CopY family transcriptional regulator [Deltaproteobacteria bacterium]